MKEVQDGARLDWLDYGARFYDAQVGRFLKVDPVAEDFPHVTPYNYAENKVLTFMDLWGLQAFSVHGTNSNPATFDKMSDSFIKKLSGNSSLNRDFRWPEGTNGSRNGEVHRKVAALALTIHVLKNLSKDGEHITLIAHSHGGNVAIQAAKEIRRVLDNKGDNRTINIVTMATPAYNGENDPENPKNSPIDHHSHYYSTADKVLTTLANMFGEKRLKENTQTLKQKIIL